MAEALIPAGGTWLMETSNSEPLALLSLSVDDRGCGWIDQLYIRPGQTGQGHGTRLLMHALALLPGPVRLYTFEANEGALRFYARHGFVILARGDGSGNEEGCPDLLMERLARTQPDAAAGQGEMNAA